MTETNVFVHESSYRGRAGFIHRSRLKSLLDLLRSLDLPSTGLLADFGCSNGFVIENLYRRGLPGNRWTYCGFDHKQELLELARAKGISRGTFDAIDLNVETDHGARFDVVACLETLEHVGNYRAALRTIFRACKPGGYIIISVPYENGLPGLAKYFGRKLLRRNAYGDFFAGKSESAYIIALLLGRSIQTFRAEEKDGWGPHLGFDSTAFEKALSEELAGCALHLRKNTFFGFNRFYVFRAERKTR